MVDVHYPGFIEVKTRGFAQTCLVMGNDDYVVILWVPTHVKTPWVSRIPVSSILQVIPFFSAPRILKAARLVLQNTSNVRRGLACMISSGHFFPLKSINMIHIQAHLPSVAAESTSATLFIQSEGRKAHQPILELTVDAFSLKLELRRYGVYINATGTPFLPC
jgi:hypothetical protein